METFSVSVMGRSIGGSALMIDTMNGSPVLHGFGNKFPIIADKDFEAMARLVLHCTVP